jgi:hypothetical protein
MHFEKNGLHIRPPKTDYNISDLKICPCKMRFQNIGTNIGSCKARGLNIAPCEIHFEKPNF